jgi:hypothetical protein
MRNAIDEYFADKHQSAIVGSANNRHKDSNLIFLFSD